MKSWMPVLLLATALPARAQSPGDALEFVGDGEPAPAEPAPAAPRPAFERADPVDTTPPRIDDFAVAASDPALAPLVSAVITDDLSGVDRALFYFRPTGTDQFQKAVLSPATGGLFLVRLPDGAQRTGFDYYVEVYDAAQNEPARLGSIENPLWVPAASESSRVDFGDTAFEGEGIHPGWVMFTMGSGLILSGAAGSLFYDLGVVVLPQLDETRNPGLEEGKRTDLRNAMMGDIVLGSLLGVAGVTALGAGAVMMALAADAE